MDEASSAVCGVCGDASDGQHFGAVACRACAAFFRRSTVTDRKYTCRYNNDCPIGKDVRCMCRACRLRKCVQLGMNAKSVQRNRDGLGSRSEKKVQKVQETAEVPSYLSSPSLTITDIKAEMQHSPIEKPVALPTPVITHLPEPIRPQLTNLADCLGGLPLISQALIGYRKMVEDRKMRRAIQPKLHVQKLFEGKLAVKAELLQSGLSGYKEGSMLQHSLPYDPTFNGWQEINFDGTTAMLRFDAAITAEMVNDYFTPFYEIELGNKQRLFRNFFACFILIERAYLTSVFFPGKNDDRFAFSHNAFFHLEDLTKYYTCEALIAHPAEAAKIFKPSYDISRRCLKNPMAEMKFTEAEMVGLLYLSLWNEATNEITDKTSAVSKQARAQIYRELFTLCLQSNPEFAPERLGQILNFLTVAQRLSTRFTENFSIAKIFDIFNCDNFLFEMMPQT